LGNLGQHNSVPSALRNLQHTLIAADAEVLRFVETQHLFDIDIGFTDAHLLAAVRLTPASMLLTRNKRLLAASTRLWVTAKPTTH